MTLQELQTIATLLVELGLAAGAWRLCLKHEKTLAAHGTTLGQHDTRLKVLEAV